MQKSTHDVATEADTLRELLDSASSHNGTSNVDGGKGTRSAILGAGSGAALTQQTGENGLLREGQTSTSPLSELLASGLLQRIPLEDIEQQASWQAGRPYPETFLGASVRKRLRWVVARMSFMPEYVRIRKYLAIGLIHLHFQIRQT
jgi:hypothetical protein